MTGLPTKLIQICKRWQQRRNMLRQLQRLDDRMLRDIGLQRSGIVPAVEDVLRGINLPYSRRRPQMIRLASPTLAVAETALKQDNETPTLHPAA